MRKVFVIGCILGLVGMVAYKLLQPTLEQRSRDDLHQRTTDETPIQQTVTILGDEWLGYLVFRSEEFRSLLREQGIGVQFVSEPNFEKRFERMAAGEADFVACTVDSLILNGLSMNYPGSIVFAIDESFGGDVILGKGGVKSLDDLRSADVTGAFTAQSPSEYLLLSQMFHFQLEELLPRFQQFRKDSAEAAAAALSDGSADFAVVWEPVASQVERSEEGITRIIDTRSARGLIYDVCVARRELIAEDPKLVQAVVDAYFTALSQLSKSAGYFSEKARLDAGVDERQIEPMLAGIRFLDLDENRRLLEKARGTELDTASQTARKIFSWAGMIDDARLSRIPEVMHYREFVMASQVDSSGPSAAVARQFFRALPDEKWQVLLSQKTGTLLEKPVQFGTGQATIPDEFKSQLRSAVDGLKHYPNHRLIVEAHVSPGSNKEADLALSQDRAEAIRNFLLAEAELSPQRIYALGKGGSEPLLRKEGEGIRGWKRRCRRARVFLVEQK